MRGQDKIINMRKEGYIPHIVHIEDTDQPEPIVVSMELPPVVCVHKDNLEMLDLRFLIGLKVFISSESEERAKVLFQLCKKAKAQWVMAGHTIRKGDRYTTGWTENYYG